MTTYCETADTNKHHDPEDLTVMHFTAEPNEVGGYFITLYRFRNGDNWNRNRAMSRPQYKGAMGWEFHSKMEYDIDAISKMHPIEKLPEITGDDLVNWVFKEGNMYAG